jgi:hypothetical protein
MKIVPELLTFQFGCENKYKVSIIDSYVLLQIGNSSLSLSLKHLKEISKVLLGTTKEKTFQKIEFEQKIRIEFKDSFFNIDLKEKIEVAQNLIDIYYTRKLNALKKRNNKNERSFRKKK